MKRIISSLLLCALCALIPGCTINDHKERSAEFYAMNTAMALTAYGDNAEAGLKAAEAEINRLDALWSIGSPGSEIARINENGGGRLSEETLTLLKEALEISRMTGGAFDITVSPLMERWGFYSGEYRVPTCAELSRLLRLVGSEKILLSGDQLTLEPGGGIDFGGIAKGYASDQAARILAKNGVSSALLSLGGNIQALGAKPDGAPWRIAIRNPRDEFVPIGILSVTDMAVITSGGYERHFEKDGKTYHHILDPKTGKPAESGLSSVTIACGRGAIADGLSTALFVMGKEKALEFWRAHAGLFDAVLVLDTGEILITAGLDGLFASDFAFEVVR